MSFLEIIPVFHKKYTVNTKNHNTVQYQKSRTAAMWQFQILIFMDFRDVKIITY